MHRQGFDIRQAPTHAGGGQLKPQTIRKPPRENSELVVGTTWGVLELTLHAESYAWRFIPVEGGSFEDSGRAPCVERRPAR